MTSTTKCYRFVKDDLTSATGDLTWAQNTWNHAQGQIICGENGLHAALTPRDSLRYLVGNRWFVAEAQGDIEKKKGRLAASDMQLVKEIPTSVLKDYAVWCAEDCLDEFETAYPENQSVRVCLKVMNQFNHGEASAEALTKARSQVFTGVVGLAASRAVESVVAASYAIIAPNSASWSNAAAAAAYAAHLSSVAINLAKQLVHAQASASQVETVADLALLADQVATANHKAASAGAIAHAAAVAAARHILVVDIRSDIHYSSFAAYTNTDTNDVYYTTQNNKLIELITAAIK